MAEIVSYEQVYKIKTSDYIIGGTNYLRKQIEKLSDKVDEIDALPGEEESRYTEIMQQLKSLDISIFQTTNFTT